MEEELSLKFSSLNTNEIDHRDDSTNEEGEERESGHESSGNCNLIINYLPQDIDDNSLRVN